MTYLQELRSHWRPLLAAFLGMGSGFSTVGTVTSAIAPSLIEDNGWSNADFAAIGGLAVLTAAAMPVAGRLADLLGVRLAALIGLVTLPLAYLGYSLMDGAIGSYIGIFVIQSIFCVTTTATVYTRLPVQYVQRARGLALAIVASGPAIGGAVMGPILNAYVEAHGWRDTYQALAVLAAIMAVIVFLLIPREPAKSAATPVKKRRASEDYGVILRAPAFWILLVAMLLCNLPQVLMLTQFKMLMLDNGVSGSDAGLMFTALSIGMLTGRFLTGVALDRLNPYVVSFATLSLPSVGLFIIASSFDAMPILTLAVIFFGFAFGAEGDIVGFLVARQFRVEVYSSVLGLLTAAMSTAAALGAALLSFTLARTGGFEMFLVLTGAALIVGSASLLLLGSLSPSSERRPRLDANRTL